jgi:enoyl-CoA hydratase
MTEQIVNSGEFVKTSIDGYVGMLELHRPPVNALNHALGAELVHAIEALEDTDVRVVILTGGERMFSAGFDIKELASADPLDAIGRNRRMYRVYRKVEEARFPVIAAINGYAVGGSCQLVLACDFRVVASDAFFSWPEIDLAGLPPMQRLVRTVGYGQARRLVYTAARCGGEEAFRLGLADVLAGPGQAIPVARQYAETIAEKPPLVVEACKKAMTLGVEVPLAAAQLAELTLAGEIAGGSARKERLTAFGHGDIG